MTIDWIRGEELEDDGEERARQEAPSTEPARVVTRPHRPVSVAASPARSNPTGVGPGPNWVPLGPSTLLLGQLEGGERGRVSGRVACLAVSDDGQRIYAGTANGGVWYSSDGGGSWTPLDSYEAHSSIDDRIHAPSLSIGAIFVLFGANADGSADQVFAATGEAVSFTSNYGESQHVGIGLRTATGPVPAVLANPAANPWTRDTTTGADALVGVAIYRIAAKVTSGTVAKLFLATSNGLYVRDFAAATQSWTRLDQHRAWDVHYDGARLWVAGRGTLRVSTNEGADFSDVTLPDSFGPTTTAPHPPARSSFNRTALAALPSGSGVYVLAGGGRLWRAQGATPPVPAVAIPGLPYDLWLDSSGDDHSTYAMALTAWANPAGGDIILAGATTRLERGIIASPTGASPTVVPTNVATGVHADFHALLTKSISGAVHVFVGNDGGVFRSNNGGLLHSFSARNDGLAVLEPYFLAGTPLSEAMLFFGTQDNGAARPSSPETWIHVFDGDAGGVAIDPADSRRVAAQYINGSWRVSLDDERIQWFPKPAATTLSSLSASERRDVEQRFTSASTAERGAGRFYSSAAAVVQPSTGKTLLAIGVTRPWLSDDWGKTWKTLPTFTDPSVSSTGTAPRDLAPRADQDRIGDVTVVRFAGPDVLFVLTQNDAYRFHRVAASGSDPEHWVKTQLSSPFGSSTTVPLRTDVASEDPDAGTLGSFYMTFAQTSGNSRERHVYWFDGMGSWVDCQLEIDAPTNAVVVDPLAPTNVYVGTDVGVFHGTKQLTHGASTDTTWTWEHFSDGLPEAPVVDLVIDERPESAEPPMADRVRLLRAALAGRGVFEIPISHTARTEPAIVAYVRAHEHDLRRSAIPATPRRPHPNTDPGAVRTHLLTATDYDPQPLDASPDVRVRRAPGTAFPRLTPDGSLFTSSKTTTRERTFAQMAIDAARRASGILSTPVDGWIKDERIPDAEWQRLATNTLGSRPTNLLPFHADPNGEHPDAADVVEFVLDEPDPGGFCSCRVHNQAARIDVTVHTRHWRELAAARVRVALLRAQYSNASGTPTASALPANWRDEVLADRTRTGAARGAWLASTSWSYVDAATPIREVNRPIDARRAGVATFEGTLPAGTWLLAAIVLADDDLLAATTETDPVTVARTIRHVALRSVHAAPEPAHHEFQEWHANQTPNPAYQGSADDRRVVERPAPAGHLRPKADLHLCTHESAVASFELDLPAGDHFGQWEILDLQNGHVVRTHPQLTPAAFGASDPSAALTSGGHAWLWDGRDDAGFFVPERTYVSRLWVKDAVGHITEYGSAIDTQGNPYDVEIECGPKGDADLVAAVHAAPSGPIDTDGQRIANDCDIQVTRGGHEVFMGHGTMESTLADGGPRFGAFSVPHGLLDGYKGWIDRPAAGSPYGVGFQSIPRSDGAVTLENASGPTPLNPYVSPPAARIDGARIVGTTAAYVTDGLLTAGIAVRDTSGTCATPAALRTTWNGSTHVPIRARNATFGTFGAGSGDDIATSTPAFANKQTKRSTPDDALDTDTHTHPQTEPLRSDCVSAPDEPLRMQATFQAAVFGGFHAAELPLTPATPASALNRLAVKVQLSEYFEDSAYYIYHHAVVLGHAWDAATHSLTISVPRKVIRGYNGQGRGSIDRSNPFGPGTLVNITGGRNVLVPGHLTLCWYVERVPTSGPSTMLAHLIGTGPSTFAALPNLGPITRTFSGATAGPGVVRSVCRYRLQLAPVGADHDWEPDGRTPTTAGAPLDPLPDPFSSHSATLDGETRDGDVLVGQSVMVLP